MSRDNGPVPVFPADRGRSWAAVILGGVLALGCHRARTVEPEPEPDPPTPTLPSLGEVEPDLTPLDLSPDPLPVGIAAAVDGEPITEEEITRLVQRIEAEADSEPVDPAKAEVEAVLRAVESRLLLGKADQLDIQVSDEEIDAAIARLLARRKIKRKQLNAEIEQLGQTWEEYRDDIVVALAQKKVLTVLGVYGPETRQEATAQALRARVVGCLRARAEVQVRDPEIELPQNPYELVAEVGEVRFLGELAVDEGALRKAARGALESRKGLRLCDALNGVELAVHEQLLEKGYFAADVYVPWPAELGPPVAVEVQVTSGPVHAFGRVKFDQSALPKRQRVDETELRKRLVGFFAPGDVFSMSAYRGASEEIKRAFQEAGIDRVVSTTANKRRGGRVVVDLTYRAAAAD